MSDDLHNEQLQGVMGPLYRGTHILNLVDETELSILEGAAEELSLPDYDSLKPLSVEVITMMYKTVMTICGTVGVSLAKRYAELTEYDEAPEGKRAHVG